LQSSSDIGEEEGEGGISMQLTKHHLTADDLSEVLKATNGIIVDGRIWLNSNSGKDAYISAKVELGFLSIQMFSVDMGSRTEAEEFLNSFEFDVEYEVMGCECE